MPIIPPLTPIPQKEDHNNLLNKGKTSHADIDKFIENYRDSVLGTLLKGLSTSTNAVIAAADSVLSALGKLQSQITGGWIGVSDTWTYASASTITIPSDGTTKYQKGMPIRWKQGGGYKYGNIQAIAATLITIGVNTDYTVANSAITDIAYSPIQSPFGFPEKFNCLSPAYGSGGSIGTYAEVETESYYIFLGKSIRFVSKKRVTNKGSWSGSVYMGTPVDSAIDGIFDMNCTVIAIAGLAPKAIGNLRNFSLISFEKAIASAALAWTDIAVNDFFQVDITYLY